MSDDTVVTTVGCSPASVASPSLTAVSGWPRDCPMHANAAWLLTRVPVGAGGVT